MESTRTVVNPFLDQNLQLDRSDPLRIRYEPHPEHTADVVKQKFGSDRLIHAGVVAAIGQEAAWSILQDPEALTTSLTVHFVRPVLLMQGQVLATAEIVRLGHTLNLSTAQVWQDHEVVAHLTACFRRRA